MTLPYRDDESVLRERIAELEEQEKELTAQLEVLRVETAELQARARAAHPSMRGLLSWRGAIFLALAVVLGVELGGYYQAHRSLSPACSWESR